MSQVGGFFVQAFQQSPSAGFAVLLFLWLVAAWWFRLIVVGPKTHFSEEVLRLFRMAHEVREDADLASVGRLQVNVSGGLDVGRWTVLDAYRAYWALRARGAVVIGSTIVLSFSAFSLVVMAVAKPAEGVSLWNVAELLGFAAFACIVLLAGTTLRVILASVHTLPVAIQTREHRLATSLFAWCLGNDPT